jgi:hypothetical protein
MTKIMQIPAYIRLLFPVVLLCLLGDFPAYAQIQKPTVRIHVDTKNYAMEAGRKNFLSSFNLYTVIRGRKYFIERLVRRVVSIPEPMVAPTGKFVFYAVNTGGGFESEGMTIFVSDVYGRKKIPILGRSWVLRPAGFLNLKGKDYLLITGESESPERDFWLYDITSGQFVLHADGEIREINKGLFSYGRNNDEGDFKEIGRVTVEQLVKNTPPLKLLPRYPTHGLTQKSNVRIYESDHCYSPGESHYKIISTAGTKVLIFAECEDGGYAIYYNGFTGKVKKETLRVIDFKLRQ